MRILRGYWGQRVLGTGTYLVPSVLRFAAPLGRWQDRGGGTRWDVGFRNRPPRRVFDVAVVERRLSNGNGGPRRSREALSLSKGGSPETTFAAWARFGVCPSRRLSRSPRSTARSGWRRPFPSAFPPATRRTPTGADARTAVGAAPRGRPATTGQPRGVAPTLPFVETRGPGRVRATSPGATPIAPSLPSRPLRSAGPR